MGYERTSRSSQVKIGDEITLFNTGNCFIPDGTQAVIEELTSYGALVKTEATKTGKYRAGWDEISHHEGNGRGKPKQSSPTGEICQTCGGVNMIRAGSCLTCQDCGSTTGCG